MIDDTDNEEQDAIDSTVNLLHVSRETNTPRKFSKLTLEDVLQSIGTEDFEPWHLSSKSKEPSNILLENLRRLEGFDTRMSAAGKIMVIDVVLAEIVTSYPVLKIWKEALLKSQEMIGIADYLVAPKRAYLSTPYLCVVEAKKDDFDRGAVQCLAGMHLCFLYNEKKGFVHDVLGIVSNGQGWQFYKETPEKQVYESELYSLEREVPEVLGALDAVFALCAKAATDESSIRRTADESSIRRTQEQAK